MTMSTKAAEQSIQNIGEIDAPNDASERSDDIHEVEIDLDDADVGEDDGEVAYEQEAKLDEQGEYTELGSQDNQVEKDV
jgi:hypothetical protein